MRGFLTVPGFAASNPCIFQGSACSMNGIACVSRMVFMQNIYTCYYYRFALCEGLFNTNLRVIVIKHYFSTYKTIYTSSN